MRRCRSGESLHELVDTGCAAAGHPLCGGWSWTYDVGVGPWRPRDENLLNLGNLLWVVGQRIWRLASPHRDPLWSLSISADEARRLSPWVDDV